ncbi:hypothetical protein AAEO56_11060 [Flavobacterium sp. DGU11]|uniref:Uncharacterized protein n=1 Tax=Flavobacterium arundinis TaxID=3139143 RepID=A0ABU9HXB8_9FLAO
MIQKPSFITSITIGGETHEIKVYGNVDKSDDMIYYTFALNDENMIVLSKFDGDEWRIANTIRKNNDIAKLLGKIIDNNNKNDR